MTRIPSEGKALLPCPFCGPGQSMVDPWFDDVSKRWAVGCGRCGASSGRSIHAEGSKEAAIKSWNIRATPVQCTDALTEEAVADAIDNARYQHPDHPRERPRPFADADRSDREYALRLARAAILSTTVQGRDAGPTASQIEAAAKEFGQYRDTPPELRDLIERAKSHVMTPQEIHEQRRSFVRGMCPSDKDYGEWSKLVDKLIPPLPRSSTGSSAPPPRREPTKWPTKGDWMTFLGKNGYEFELTEARNRFDVGGKYLVEDCNVGNWSHSIKFDGMEGWFNGVMFERCPVPSTHQAGVTK